MPIRPFRDEQGRPMRIEVSLAGRPTQVQMWQARVGRVNLILLDIPD